MLPSTGIIFDLDGTLVDSLQDITNALNVALRQINKRTVKPERVRTWIGDGLPVLCERAATHVGAQTQCDRLTELAQFAYAEHFSKTTVVYPNILQMLRLLKSNDVPMAVLSNKPHAFTLRTLEWLDLMDFFQIVRGYVCEKDKKPSPAQALAIADQMQLRADRVLFVGDSVTDIQTARNADMKAIAVAWGFKKKSELLAAKPDFFLSDPLEIPALVKKNI